MDLFGRAVKAIHSAGLEGWLFYSFHASDPVAAKVLRIKKGHNTRPWVYLLSSNKKHIKIVHAIEQASLEHLPGQTYVYKTRTEFLHYLGKMKDATVAANFSPEFPQISFIDHGVVKLLLKAGIKLTSNNTIIAEVLSKLNTRQISEHEEAAAKLYTIMGTSFQLIKEKQGSISEGDIQKHIVDSFRSVNMITEHRPLVAFGKNTANPHYELQGAGKFLNPGDCILIDMWAKNNTETGIYADISWAGYHGKDIPEIIEKTFDLIVNARELAVEIIKNSMSTAEPVSGYEVDKKLRDLFINNGHQQHLAHRTGHSIDSSPHGQGVNLDSIEFPDKRPLGEGSLFSLEPGLYLENFGFRSEINVYIKDGNPVVSGKEPQRNLERI